MEAGLALGGFEVDSCLGSMIERKKVAKDIKINACSANETSTRCQLQRKVELIEKRALPSAIGSLVGRWLEW